MKLYSTLAFNERLDKVYVAQITDTHPEFRYNRKFVFRKDNDKESRENDTYERRLHGQTVHYEYEYDIKESGIYECMKVDGVNEDWSKKCVCYIDAKNEIGEIIGYKNVVGLLNAIKNGEKIDLDNVRNY